MGKEDVVKNLELCGKYFIKQMVEANAETLKYTIEGFSHKEKKYGDFVITVKKKK